MTAALATSLALAGLVAGWGLRAVTARYAVPAGEPRRRGCPACGHPAAGQRPRWFSPRSCSPRWFLPRPSGRCPACGQRTGPPPFAVEAATALTLAALALRVHPGLVLAAACWLAVCAVPLAFIDAAVRRLPDLLTAPAYAGTGLLLVAAAARGGHWHDLLRAGLGGLALAGFCLAVAVASRGGMGLGDVKAAASLGTLLAWRGWSTLLAGAFAGFLLAAAYGIVLLLAGRATRKQHIPFGPFLIIGAFAAMLAW